jgi:hypothetical protein
MSYTFKGNLQGEICEDCKEALYGMEVLLYLPWRKETNTGDVPTNQKDDFRIVTKEEASQRANLLIARAKTDENGNFEFEIDEKYDSSSFDIDFICYNAPYSIKKDATNQALQMHLTTVFPRQEDSWSYTIPYKIWCDIRGRYFDAWVICGHLLNCQNNEPIVGATVTAWDADFLTDDTLGSAITDASGHFRIDYNSLTFKRTFLSPWINVETDPGLPLSFQSGPDVYFKAELSGNKLIDETKEEARKNVAYCLCVNLCSKINVFNENDTFDSAWTGFGTRFSASFGTGYKDFDADGYAGSDKNVLHSAVDLTGQAPLKSSLNRRIKYRFRISHVTTPNNAASPADMNFSKTIGVTAGLFEKSQILTLEKKVPTGVNDSLVVESHQDDFDAQGWFDATNAVERTLINNGYAIGDLPLFKIIETDTLITLNTTALTTQPNVPPTAAGVPIAPANLIAIEKMAIRFEIGELTSGGTIAIQPTNGKTLNSVIINNNPIAMNLAIAELEATGLCNPISGDVHAKYTVYHPHIQSFSMSLRNNSNTVNRGITDGLFMPLAGNQNPSVTGHANLSLKINNPPTDMSRCTYTLKLVAQTRLHNGRNQEGQHGPLEQLFFYEI